MSRNNPQHSRTRRTVARVAVASALALAPVTVLAVPAFAAPVALEPSAGLDAAERPGHGRHGHGHGHGHGRGHGHGHGDWNHGRHGHDHDWDRGRHGKHDWDRGHHGRGYFPLPSTGSAF
ncbi:hypothetical protein IU440_05105 [Nocardia cyriacigeorgica]|uniref:Uncharacterized protein n=1 Tax=Nocardia cyriacigeorgica (strain GUH-2) TaxID=1127134 RepID=H6R843_NOCCG|nr:hypothetical protein [Nocardia cyriacigeorgica]MBF6424055.1 hypothetical protein [Nocardia cyriacigeorgica]CCF64793.1 exported protein of unknown function [Nocardia cyriacigeorgica GUH-2]